MYTTHTHTSMWYARTHARTHTHIHTLTGNLVSYIQNEHPIFCSAVFSACLLHSLPKPCSHAASISLIQSICIFNCSFSIAFSLLCVTPSWSPRCSHWYATPASATVNKGKSLMSVSKTIILFSIIISPAHYYFTQACTHSVCHQKY